MKKSEAVIELSKKLQKSQNLFDGYKNGKISLKCLCDNLATRSVDFLNKDLEMTPPPKTRVSKLVAKNSIGFQWDKEDE